MNNKAILPNNLNFTTMKKENFDVALWALTLVNAIKRNITAICDQESRLRNKEVIANIQRIANDAIAKIEAEVEKLD